MSDKDIDNLLDSISLEDSSKELEDAGEEIHQLEQQEAEPAPAVAVVQVGGARSYNGAGFAFLSMIHVGIARYRNS